MIREHDRVALASDLPNEGLENGAVGTVIHIYQGGAAYVVEFMNDDGDTVAIVTLEQHQVRPAGER